MVDFEAPARDGKSLTARFYRHGHVKLPDLMAMLNEGGFKSVETGALGNHNLWFPLARVPC